MSFLKKLEEFVGSKKASVDELRKASIAAPSRQVVCNDMREHLAN